MKIILAGNPNVGKSALFNRLTGADVLISNYAGTTVEYTQGELYLGEVKVPIIDSPGSYSLDATNKAEEVTRDMVKEADTIINVIDSTNLERNLYFTLQLLAQRKKTVIALNMWDETAHKGIHIDAQKLHKILGVPVIPVCAITAEGIKKLVDAVPNAKVSPYHSDNYWKNIGEIIQQVQTLTHKHHTFKEILEEITIHPISGIPFALAVLGFSLFTVRGIAETLISTLFDPFFEKIYTPLIMKAVPLIHNPLLSQILMGNIPADGSSLMDSLGLLTTGVYIPVAEVFPYLMSFYVVLGILEDIGYLPRLAVIMDAMMHKIGLHGTSFISFILGMGCNIPGVLSTRILESKKERFLTATLLAISIPCMAQLSMVVGVLGKRGMQFVALVFLILFIIWAALGIILNKLIRGESPEIMLEIPPYRKININFFFKKLWFRLTHFIKEALPLVVLGIIFTNIFYSLGIIAKLGIIFRPIVVHLWGLTETSVIPLMIGILRKDIAIGMLAPLLLTTKQLVIACVILTVYFPCMASFIILFKELGLKDLIKSTLLMILVAIGIGTILNIVLFRI